MLYESGVRGLAGTLLPINSEKLELGMVTTLGCL